MKQLLHRLDLGSSTVRVLQIAAAGLLLATMFAQVFVQPASAAQLTARKVTINNSEISATGVQYDFTFSWATAGNDVEGVKFEFCTTPIGACTLPAGMVVAHTSTVLDGHTNFPANGTAFAEVTANTGECSDVASTMYCINRTEVTTGTGTAATVDLSGITNPNTQTSVYVRINLYPNSTFTASSSTENGTVAAATARQLTVNGRVQERLRFCVAAIDDAAVLPTDTADCVANFTSSTIDLGVIDNTSIQIAPQNEADSDGANDDYGIAMVDTNSGGGAAIVYFPEAASSGTNELRSFRVTGATCNVSGTATDDQCFVDGAGAGETFTAGTERFGMYIACFGTEGTTANLGAAGTGAGLAGTYNAAYSGTDDAVTEVADCENEAGALKYAWSDSATAAALVSSTTAVEDELVKLRFAATAAATTPTGAYTVSTTYIATPTF